MTNPAIAHPSALRHSGFGFLSSFDIRHLSFDNKCKVRMHAEKRKEALHESSGGGSILRAEEPGSSSADETSAAPCWLPPRAKLALSLPVLPGERCSIKSSQPANGAIMNEPERKDVRGLL